MEISNINLNLLQNRVLEILKEHLAGIKEYDLITKLQADKFLPDNQPGDNLQLFQIHFVLFHALYLLRNQLRQKEEADLEITPFNICLKGYYSGQIGLTIHDPLSDYYLNLDQLIHTTEKDVNKLLDEFWEKLQAHEHLHEALNTFGLNEATDYAAIKNQYRVLAKQHHPDNGGDKQRFQEINRAMQVLEIYYGPVK